MKINSKHYILIIFAIGTVILSILGYIIVYRTVVTQAKDSSKALIEINTESEKKQYEDGLTKLFDDTSSDRLKLSSFFVREDRIVDFIEKVEKIGVDSNTELTLSSINADDLNSVKVGTIGRIKTRITASGSWANVMRALVLIENLPYSLSMNDVRVDSSSGSNAELSAGDKKTSKGNKWNLSLNMEVLIMK